MESSGKQMINAYFGHLADIKIKNLKEYDDIMCDMLGKVADDLGLARVVYNIYRPENAPFAFKLPPSVLLFEGLSEPGEEYIAFRRTYVKNGTIEFVFYPEKDKTFSPENAESLKALFYILFNGLSTFFLEILYDRLTTSDLATGIPNLSAFIGFCGMLIAQGKLNKYVAFNFNIHNFKMIQQSLTYLEGNKVMEMYCDLVSNAVTRSELVARLGGDNFVAIILDEHKDYFLDLINNIVIKFRKEKRIITFNFGATVGASKLSDEKNPGEIMREISTAYQTARETRSLLSYYDKKLSHNYIERKIILSKFFEAIGGREFKVYYQPKVSLQKKELCGAEALVRWIRPDGGMVMPGSFIPVIEKDGCICTLDFYMLDEVCKFQKKLLDENITPVKVSVNFSKRHLSNNKLVEEIAEVVDRYNIPHSLIEIELTESEDFHNNGVMKDIVDELNALGIRTSIDDFGTGYSSFGMLRTLQLDTLKIDRSFIPRKEDDEKKSLLMLGGVVSLAKSLGLTTVAEGVETQEQLKILESMDCDIIQGYIFDKPLPEVEFIQRLKNRQYHLEETK